MKKYKNHFRKVFNSKMPIAPLYQIYHRAICNTEYVNLTIFDDVSVISKLRFLIINCGPILVKWFYPELWRTLCWYPLEWMFINKTQFNLCNLYVVETIPLRTSPFTQFTSILENRKKWSNSWIILNVSIVFLDEGS